MLTTPGAVSPISMAKPVAPPAAYGAAASHMAHKYDQATFSNYAGKADSFQMNLVSRLSQEVRTATTTADIRELHEAVQSGTYVCDPYAIAGRMLFFSEG